MGVFADVLAFVGGSAVLLGAIAWLIRAALGHTMQKDIVEFKLRLENAANIEVEKLRHELRMVEAERSKQSNLLLEKRATVIDTLYKLLVDYLAAAESFTSLAEWSGEPSKEEKAKLLGDASDAFFKFFVRHRIYFSSELCAKLRELMQTVRAPTISYRVWLASSQNGDGTGGKLMEAWDKAARVIQTDVPHIMDSIDAEFRVLLGVTRPIRGDG